MLNKKSSLFLYCFSYSFNRSNQSFIGGDSNVVKNLTLRRLLAIFTDRLSSPLYYLFINYGQIFGYSEIALRMPSVLFSLMTGYVVYLIGGIWSAIPI